MTGSDDTYRAGVGCLQRVELLQLKGSRRRFEAWRSRLTGPVYHRFGRQNRTGMGRRQRNRTAPAQRSKRQASGVAAMPDGRRIVTGSDDKPRGYGMRVPEPTASARRYRGSFLAWQSCLTGPVSSPARTTIPRGCGMPVPEPSCSSSKVTRARSQLSLPCWAATSSSPDRRTALRGYGTLPLASSCSSSMDTRFPSRASPSRPTALASSPLRRTTPRGYGTPEPALPCSGSWDTTSQCWRGRHIGRVQYRHGDGRLDIVGVGCP